jgi:beta-lactamase superfamily II metal-dependent hydrolase
MSNSYIKFFPVGNGDSTLIKAGNRTVMTDIHYRQSCKEEDSDEYDFQKELKSACKDGREYRLSLFVSTHPDQDHTKGFEEIFHTGDPLGYDTKNGKILVEEIWCSPYTANPHYETDDSKALIKEIKRRKKIQSTQEGNASGNRLKILDLDSSPAKGELGDHLEWELLAPTENEADIEKSEDPDKPNSSNNSSLVIRWTYTDQSATEYIVLGGDAEVEIWERIRDDFSDSTLKWSILLAPHHCSRCSMAKKNEDDKYEYSDDALSALGQVHGDGFIISSSKPIKNDDDNPPSWDAKQKYLKILKDSYSTDHKERFLNPESYNNGKPETIVFELTHKGLKLKSIGYASATSITGTGAASKPTTYG